ncbi:MAG: hypothetical protein AAF402_11845 [Pseudomonadota bacterium]
MKSVHEPEVVEFAEERWSQPNSFFGSGMDSRSSDNAMLCHLYGALIRASQYDWQNAGRVMLDRTDVRILFDSYQAVLPFRQLDVCCRELDRFVRDHVFSQWWAVDPNSVGPSEDRAIAIAREWVAEISESVFGDREYRFHAELVLFFSCPFLPVVPSRQGPISVHFAGVQEAVRRPAPVFGDAEQYTLIQSMLEQTDWWLRRLHFESIDRPLRDKLCA